jgi:cyanophycinase
LREDRNKAKFRFRSIDDDRSVIMETKGRFGEKGCKMGGHLVLQGGGEFGGEMKTSDLRAMELAGGASAAVCIIPAAAAPDNNHLRAGQNGCDWFRSLGAGDVSLAMVTDRESANDKGIVHQLRRAGIVYLLGGFPAYLAGVLEGSRCWKAVRDSLDSGLVLSGSSAGAMVLCDHLFDPYEGKIAGGLGLLTDCCIMPHHDTFGHRWAAKLQNDLPRATLVGIDEQTAMIDDGPGGEWTVYGPGRITLYANGQVWRYAHGERFKLAR